MIGIAIWECLVSYAFSVTLALSGPTKYSISYTNYKLAEQIVAKKEGTDGWSYI